MKVLIVLGGDAPGVELLKSCVREADFSIAADKTDLYFSRTSGNSKTFSTSAAFSSNAEKASSAACFSMSVPSDANKNNARFRENRYVSNAETCRVASITLSALTYSR